MRKLDELMIKAAVKANKLMEGKDNGSMTIETLIIVIVLAVLAIVFKTKLNTSVDEIFKQFDNHITDNVFKAL